MRCSTLLRFALIAGLVTFAPIGEVPDLARGYGFTYVEGKRVFFCNHVSPGTRGEQLRAAIEKYWLAPVSR